MLPSEVQDLFLSFQKTMIERTIAAEMNLHLGYRPGEDKPEGQANERNGASGKTVLTEHGPVTDEVMAETIACSNGKLAYTAQRDKLRLGGGSYSVAVPNDIKIDKINIAFKAKDKEPNALALRQVIVDGCPAAND